MSPYRSYLVYIVSCLCERRFLSPPFSLAPSPSHAQHFPRCLRQFFGKQPSPSITHSHPSRVSLALHARESGRRYRTTLRRKSYRASFVIYLSLSSLFVVRDCMREREREKEYGARTRHEYDIHIYTSRHHTHIYKHTCIHKKNT